MRKAIAIDFDGCICTNAYPDIGAPNWSVINKACAEHAAGAGLILWTCREGELLRQAVDACTKWGLHFDAVNNSLPSWIAAFGNHPRKIGATEYWDDRAVVHAAEKEQLASRISSTLPVGDRLCQLAEESAELAQAALKVKRILEGRNPAAADLKDALSNLQEEIGDVLICTATLSTDFDLNTDTPLPKLQRWVSRLEKAAQKNK